MPSKLRPLWRCHSFINRVVSVCLDGVVCCGVCAGVPVRSAAMTAQMQLMPVSVTVQHDSTALSAMHR